MVKFVLDADGAIKLTKANILTALTGFARCIITEQVYAEILKGKEKMYEDAFIIEDLVVKKKIALTKIKPMLENKDLGIGELSTLALFQKTNADAIISDDRKFISLLESKGIPFIIPIDIITILAIKKILSSKEALNALENIKLIVREDNYFKAKKLLEEK